MARGIEIIARHFTASERQSGVTAGCDVYLLRKGFLTLKVSPLRSPP